MTYRLFLYAPNVAFTARVNQQSFTYPIAEVAYDSGVTFDDVLSDYTVVFGTAAGRDDLGRQRLRAGSTIGATGTLKFGRSSLGVQDGSVNLEDDAYITVYEDRRPWGIFPNESGFPAYKDEDIEAGDYMAESPPVANAGRWHAASLAGGTSIVVAFDGSASFATASGATITGYLWDVDDGQVTIGDLTDAQITAQFPVGFRYVSLTVTDSNGKSHTAYAGVYCRDPNDDDTVQAFEVENLSRRIEGQELSVRILDDIPASTYPNGTLVMLWKGEPASASDRSHMQFVGWHQSDPAQITGDKTGTLKDTVLHCADIAHVMRRLPAYTQVVSRTANTGEYAGWSLVDGDNAHMDWFLWYLLHWHSTVLQLTDWTWSGTTTDYPFVVLGADGQNLWDQVQSRAKALVPDYWTTCNRYGRLRTIVDPMLQDEGDRTATVQAALTESNIADISWESRYYPRINQLRAEAILASTSEIIPIFAIAPGTARSQGLDEQVSGEQLAKSQADLNSVEGHRYARLNAPYGMLSIALAEALDIEPADMTWVTITLSATYAAQRGLTFTTARALVHEVTRRIERRKTGEAVTIELLCELETVGEPAVTEVVEDILPDPEWDPGDDPGYDPGPGPGGGDGFGTNYVMTSTRLYRTRDLSASSPTWAVLFSDDGTGLYDFILDPWDPVHRGYLLTDNGVYRSTNLDETSPTFSNILSAATIQAAWSSADFLSPYKIIASINISASGGGASGHIGFAYKSGDGMRYSVSGDGGDSWNHYTIQTGGFSAGASSGGYSGGLDYVPHLIGGEVVLYFVRYYDTVLPNHIRVYRSLDGGQNWTQRWSSNRNSGATAGGVSLHCPYHNNSDGDTLYWTEVSVTWKSADGGDTRTAIGPDPDTTYATHKRHGLETHPQDSNHIWMWHGMDFYVSTDGGVSWIQKSATGLTGSGTYASGGFPSDQNQYYVVTNKGVWVSEDGGANFVNKLGDIEIDSNDDIVGLSSAYRAVIVPLWVAE